MHNLDSILNPDISAAESDKLIDRLFRDLSNAGPLGFQFTEGQWRELDSVHRKILNARDREDRQELLAAIDDYRKNALLFFSLGDSRESL